MCACLAARLPFETEEDTDHHIAKSLQLDFRTIISVTNNFSEANKIGQGGFGAVYRVLGHYIYINNSSILFMCPYQAGTDILSTYILCFTG